MNVTIDVGEKLHRRLEVEAARRGGTVRDLVADGIRAVIDAPPDADAVGPATTPATWDGVLRSYAASTDGHDLGAMRASMARGRKRAVS